MEESERQRSSFNYKNESNNMHKQKGNKNKQIECFNRKMCCCKYLFLVFILIICCCNDSAGQQLQSPLFTTQPSSSGSIVSEGGTKVLQCEASGYPTPTYRWLKDGIPVGDYSESSFYRIINTSRVNAGSYQCIAKNKAGSIFSEKIHVVVAYMESFENVSDRYESVTSGHPAIFDLPPIDSMPAPSVTWQTAEGALKYDIKYAFTKSNQLIILSTNEIDRNVYRARAFNTQLGKEEKSGFIHLNVTGDPYVEVAPEIIVHSQDMKVRRGEQVTELQCIANARPLHELETRWYKDGIPIEQTAVAYRLTDQWNRTLALLSANLTHSGTYTCQVRLRSGGYEPVKANSKVEILEPPFFSAVMPTESMGEFGAAASLPCNVYGDPTPKVQWYKNAEPIDLRNGKFFISQDNTLHIKKLALNDSAMYQCLATNEAGEKSAYTWLRIKTAAPVMEQPPQNVTALDGKDATIVCRAAGSPNPNITWIYNGKH